MATNGNFAHQEQYKGSAEQYSAASPPVDNSNSAPATTNISKDEVGWYFVESYYTTLSKNPEKLHLFYGKRSQFVQGQEAEVAPVSVGRHAIQERIRQLDFQDGKVRISNVDSQASSDDIVIQVIGEISNKSAAPNKFVQTFVLAQQPSGYFVLNDILRYIKEEGQDEPAGSTAGNLAANEPTQAPNAVVPASTAERETASAEVSEEQKAESSKLDANVVDQKLNETKAAKDEPAMNGGSVHEEANAGNPPEAKPEVAAAPAEREAAVKELAQEDARLPEKPQDPAPTPAAKPVEPVAPAEESTSEQPPAPPKPMTWANRAAAAAGPRPVVPLPKTATPPSQNQNRGSATSAAAASTTTPTQTAAAAAAATPASAPAPVPVNASSSQGTAPVAAAETAAKESSGWQMAGADSRRQNRPLSISGNFAEKEGTMGYVKYVTEKVQDADLRSALTAHGELTYFDINRGKNCAFVEYKTVEGYQAAVASNPHVVNGENIVVEPRRPKATAYGGSNYGSGRGNASSRGRSGYDGNRGGGPGNSRGNYSSQGRGRGMSRGGRGGLQASNV